MPLHVQPALRSREKALEANGLIQTLNSVGYTRIVDAEAAGKRPAAVAFPVSGFWHIRGTRHTPAT